MLELTFLGSGHAFAPGRYWSCALLNRRYLLDCAPTALPHLKLLGVPLADIRAVFVSHFHGDHILGLPFLLLEYAELTPRTEELTIFGPTGTQEVVESITERVFPGILQKSRYGLRYREVIAGLEERLGELAVLPLAVRHTDKMPCFGYRLTLNGRTVAYSGDAAMDSSLQRLADGADVFVVECTQPSGTSDTHLTLDDIRKLRASISRRTTFILTHLGQGLDVKGLEGVLLAQDLASFIFP